MRILVVYAHPNPESFNGAILKTVVGEIDKRGHECEIHDLYRQRFQPVLTGDDFDEFNRARIPPDIAHERQAVKAADVVFFIHPVWWFGMPAILKGWVERVFTYGFAYSHDSKGVKPLLAGKKAIVVNTTGAPEKGEYLDDGFGEAYFKVTDKAIYNFVGMDVAIHRMFYQIPSKTREERHEMLETLRLDLGKIL